MRYAFIGVVLFLFSFPALSQRTHHFTYRELDSMEFMSHLPHFGTKNNLSLSNNGIHRIPRNGHVNSATAAVVPNVCFDTSGRFSLQSIDEYNYTSQTIKAADGNLLVCGQYGSTIPPYENGGYIMKCDEKGNVLWNKNVDSANHVRSNFLSYYRVYELADGSIMLGGQTNDPSSGNNDLVITKLTSAGNLIWNKTYKSRLWLPGTGSSNYFYIQDMKQDPFSGEFYVAGPHWHEGKALLKIDSQNGNLIWSTKYDFNSNGMGAPRPYGFEIRQNEIRYFGNNLVSGSVYIDVIRIDKQTGDTIASKVFKMQNPNINLDILGYDQLMVKENGNYLITGKCFGYYQYPWDGISLLNQTVVAEIDSSLSTMNSVVYQSAVETGIPNSQTTLYPDGSGLISYLHVYSGYTADIYYTQFLNGRILKSRKRSATNEGFPYEPRAIRTSDGGDMIVKLVGDSIRNNARIDFTKLHISDTSSACLGFDDFNTYTQNVVYVPYQYYVSPTIFDDFVEIPSKTLTLTDKAISKQFTCLQTSFCDSLSLSPRVIVSCPGQAFNITLHKNKECGAHIPLFYNGDNISSMIPLNDSVYSFTFNTTWTGKIYSSLQGCNILSDSVTVNILQAPLSIALGSDKEICAGNKIVLNAHSGFAGYKWQDGSTDSLFVVTAPGKYFVTATNACGGFLSDTILITPHSVVPVNIGSDRIKCNSDTVQLHAPSGFISYSWKPDYNLSSVTNQHISVNPLIDTSYILSAELTPGCYGYDTVKIIVNTSPLISLGNDKSFCYGDSLIVNAGFGFNSYQWSNGSSAQQTTLHSSGDYKVIGTTIEGCKSYDTIKILNVYALPQVKLNKDSILCVGSQGDLDAGPGYANYLWNTGANAQHITVNAIGNYRVTVTDSNGCKNSDSTSIKLLAAIPAEFLSGNDSVCVYGDLTIASLKNFKTYLWSNGHTGKSLTVTQPGRYILEVSDQNNCVGKDTVAIFGKQCLQGFFIPTAFTPNDDGLNDVFLPKIFGNLKNYQFRIYNRYGQLVFSTANINTGWTGKAEGQTFTWVCTFQLSGEAIQTKKGSVILVR